jgi:hypothetical protein
MAKQKKRKTIKPPGKCIFCNGTGLSKEHIWSDWLKKYLKQDSSSQQLITDLFLDHTTKTAYIREVRKDFQGTMNQRKVRKVCEKCNNGWMRKTVDDSLTFVKSMIHGEPVSLNRHSQVALSAWIAISTVMAEFTDHPEKVIIPAADRKTIMETSAPPDLWTIYIGKYSGTKWGGPIWHDHRVTGYFSENNLGLLPPGPLTFSTPGIKKGQLTTYALGFLIIQACSVVDDEEKVLGFRKFPRHDALLQIWPIRSDIVNWPCAAVIRDPDLDALFSSFRESLPSGEG